jgi:hypothetical protein
MLKFLRKKLLNPVLANQKEMLTKLNILYEYAAEQKWTGKSCDSFLDGEA